jgi:hypothetical protein
MINFFDYILGDSPSMRTCRPLYSHCSMSKFSFGALSMKQSYYYVSMALHTRHIQVSVR